MTPAEIGRLAALLTQLGYADCLREDGPDFFVGDQWSALAGEARVPTPTAAERLLVVAAL